MSRDTASQTWCLQTVRNLLFPTVGFKHAEAAPLDPIANQIRYTTQSTSANYWNNELLWGEPSPETEIAWNNGLGGKLFVLNPCFVLMSMLSVRRFRLHPDEAVRLNVSDSVRLKPGDDLAVITGVLHNLHCLVGALSFKDQLQI